MSSTDDGNEIKVGPPGIRTGVVIKFAIASMAMVATPTSIFFLSQHGYLDCALPTSSSTVFHQLPLYMLFSCLLFPAGFWALSVGIPEESQRAAVSGIAAVAAVNVVRSFAVI